jgi:hypothetical protein
MGSDAQPRGLPCIGRELGGLQLADEVLGRVVASRSRWPLLASVSAEKFCSGFLG